MNRNSKRAQLRSLCVAALSAALSLVFLFFGSTSGIFDMSAVVVCGLLTVVSVTEAGRRRTACSVAVCTTLSFLILPDKSTALLYLTAGGIYPLIKPYAERFGKIVSRIIKLCAAEVVIGIYTAFLMLFMPGEFSKALIPAAVLLGTACIAVYDILLTRFELIYRARISRER